MRVASGRVMLLSFNSREFYLLSIILFDDLEIEILSHSAFAVEWREEGKSEVVTWKLGERKNNFFNYRHQIEITAPESIVDINQPLSTWFGFPSAHCRRRSLSLYFVDNWVSRDDEIWIGKVPLGHFPLLVDFQPSRELT